MVRCRTAAVFAPSCPRIPPSPAVTRIASTRRTRWEELEIFWCLGAEHRSPARPTPDRDGIWGQTLGEMGDTSPGQDAKHGNIHLHAVMLTVEIYRFSPLISSTPARPPRPASTSSRYTHTHTPTHLHLYLYLYLHHHHHHHQDMIHWPRRRRWC